MGGLYWLSWIVELNTNWF